MPNMDGVRTWIGEGWHPIHWVLRRNVHSAISTANCNGSCTMIFLSGRGEWCVEGMDRCKIFTNEELNVSYTNIPVASWGSLIFLKEKTLFTLQNLRPRTDTFLTSQDIGIGRKIALVIKEFHLPQGLKVICNTGGILLQKILLFFLNWSRCLVP